MKTKNLKVLYSCRSTAGTYYLGGTTTMNPKISMEGKWLESLGFHIGDRLQVEYCDGEIHIRLAEPNPQPAMVCEENNTYKKTSKK